jgi:hypothetical protein
MRLGLLMLGSKVLLIPGIVVLAVGVTLQAGATGAGQRDQDEREPRGRTAISPTPGHLSLPRHFTFTWVNGGP